MRRRTHHMLTDADKKRIWVLHTQGVKRRFIAERFGCSANTVGYVIKKRQTEIDNNS